MRTILILILSLSVTSYATERSPKQRYAFVKQNPCPSTGLNRGACPGYVVDHIRALACGGDDAPYNMQWQSVQDAKAKDKIERKYCELYNGR